MPFKVIAAGKQIVTYVYKFFLTKSYYYVINVKETTLLYLVWFLGWIMLGSLMELLYPFRQDAWKLCQCDPSLALPTIRNHNLHVIQCLICGNKPACQSASQSFQPSSLGVWSVWSLLINYNQPIIVMSITILCCIDMQ